MATAVFSFRDLIDVPMWQGLASSPSAGGNGSSVAFDMRNNEDRCPMMFELVSNAILNRYNAKNDGWVDMINPGLGGTFNAGAGAIFAPQRGPRGTLTAVASASQFTLSALAASVPPNQFANRGDGVQGVKIRIWDPVAGKTGETYIVANTGGTTTPVVNVSPALAWTPSTSSNYEMLSGRVYLIGAGTTSTTSWQYYDVALNVMSGGLSIANLPASMNTDSCLLCLDELYVPANMSPGQGYFGDITATGSTSTTLTGSASGGDSQLLANEFRNFQIRIITDSVTPGSVGQRRKITSHTAGPSVVYTVPTWTTTPSSSAVFVIENTNEILVWTSSLATTYTYAQDAIAGGQSANTWSTTTYAARPAAMGAGCEAVLPFGIANQVVANVTDQSLYPGVGATNIQDPNKNFRYSQILSIRGGNVSTIDQFDLAAGTAGVWTAAVPVGGSNQQLYYIGTGSCYDAVTNNGQEWYINQNGGQYFQRMDLFSRQTHEWTYSRYGPRGTAVTGNKMAVLPFIDPSGAPKMAKLLARIQSAASSYASQELFGILVSR